MDTAGLPKAPKAGPCQIFRLRSKGGVSDHDR